MGQKQKDKTEKSDRTRQKTTGGDIKKKWDQTGSLEIPGRGGGSKRLKSTGLLSGAKKSNQCNPHTLIVSLGNREPRKHRTPGIGILRNTGPQEYVS